MNLRILAGLDPSPLAPDDSSWLRATAAGLEMARAEPSAGPVRPRAT